LDPDSERNKREASLRQFLHDLAAPLSAVALHLETATRKVKQGKDPLEALQTAQRELEKAFAMFDRGRMEIMGASSGSYGEA
jgi:hypothetical protein